MTRHRFLIPDRHLIFILLDASTVLEHQTQIELCLGASALDRFGART